MTKIIGDISSLQVLHEFETLKSKNYEEYIPEGLRSDFSNAPPEKKMDEEIAVKATSKTEVEAQSRHQQTSRCDKQTNQNEVPSGPQKNRTGYSRGCCMFMFRCRLCPPSCELGITL